VGCEGVISGQKVPRGGVDLADGGVKQVPYYKGRRAVAMASAGTW
jgi:hypothetical protein